ncbi:MAG: hypothetical protein HRU26_13685 [Psychroserpens sp.]|nr:hypothetical protein [Psychroserpens sp.]
MIASFFSQSKPIHFVITSVVLLLIFVATKYVDSGVDLSALEFIKQSGLFGVCLFSLFVLDFFVSKNNLTKKNSYKLLLFVLFFALIPETLLHSRILVANLFILLAIRRIISIRSKKAVKKKLFDASFWISIATLFYFWSILFFGLVISALIVFVIVDLKNWIIPFIGIITVGILVLSYAVLTQQDFMSLFENFYQFNFDFSSLNSRDIIITATLLFALGLWSLFYYLKNLRSRTKNLRPSLTLIIIAAVIALLVIVFAPTKNGSEFIFLFAPLAIIITNYLEVISETWFKEFILWIFILTPIGLLML